MNINLQNWPYFAFIVFLLVLAGLGEYFHLVPTGIFGSLLLVAIGLVAPSPVLHSPVSQETIAATQANTVATQQNTAATKAAADHVG